ncbi:MAG: DUF1926 domain-containing protein [Candidatus Krumholzibacteriota bacterium]|nr:DUF1926 domain-containing protein [Candidatus Krumholzibacteriota bacterium]
MKHTVTFILGLHNHQPVGNFEHVIEEAYERAYLPFLEVLEEYPHIPFALHNSGILWDWFASRHPEYVELLDKMVARGQVELMSGGYYEPILTVIPERDRQGQLAMMRRHLEARSGRPPRGCWLTERIWDPHLPRTLANAGLEYVVVDDSHFRSTGFRPGEMRGYFRTEEDGAYVNVFPIDKKLRYLIPFHDPAETIEYLRGVAEENGGGTVVLADDGEKFGLWTGTHDLCYGQGRLRRFCDALTGAGDWLRLSTFERVLDDEPPAGIVYLPTASYSEMMEWALSLPAQKLQREARRVLDDHGGFGETADLVRGGFWRNFLVKYEESNWMHKRMLEVSGMLAAHREQTGEDDAWREAAGHLYQAQCNCAYWHGLFGGLYLPHLRSAVFTHIIGAEKTIETAARAGNDLPAVRVADIDGDGVEEVCVATPAMKIVMKRRGAALREFDLREPAFNLTDTLTRREEIYHARLADLGAGGPADGAVSIHDVLTAKETGLEKIIAYDRFPRHSLLDRFIDADATLADYARAACDERGNFVSAVWDLDVDESGDLPLLRFVRDGLVETADGARNVRIEKRVSPLGPTGLEARWTLRAAGGGLRCRFAVESVFSFLAGDAPDRYVEIPGREIEDRRLASTGEERDVAEAALVDEWLGLRARFCFEPTALFWRYPIETVSNSDAGFERVYQGTAIVPVFDLDLADGEEASFRIEVRVEKTSRPGEGRG